jgi:hypothetical protein
MSDEIAREVKAVLSLLRRVTSAENHLERVSAAWHALDHDGKFAVGEAAPGLVDALIRIPRQTTRQEDPT